MAAYLRQHRPVRDQFRTGRRLQHSPLPGRLTGCTVLHTAESIDLDFPDAGAEDVAAWMTRRTDAGSYHHIADSDSVVHLVDLADEAYQDGTGSNPWAMSISFALRAVDWPRLSPERRTGFLRQGALAFAAQQAWLLAHGQPATPLRRISKVESDRGAAGFITHGDRDPGRRSDPGRDFPWDEWFAACAAATGTAEEDDLFDVTRDRKQLDEAREYARLAAEAAKRLEVQVKAIRGELAADDEWQDDLRAAVDRVLERQPAGTDTAALAKAIVAEFLTPAPAPAPAEG